MLNPHTYIHIEYWMTELGLSIVELFIFAIIHGFSQDGKSYFSGSQQYFRIWTGKAKSTVIAALNSLKAKGLIVVKEIRVDGHLFNTYYTTESRKNSVKSENRTGLKIGLVRSENQTCEVRKSDLGGTVFGHNNIYNNINKAAASDNTIDSAVKAQLSKKIAELFDNSKVLDSNSLDELEKVILDAKIAFEQVGNFVQFVFEKTVSKNPDSIQNLFRKLIFAPDVVQDYILKNPPPTKRKITYILCPICNKEFDELLGYCPDCSLSVVAIRNNNEQEIAVCSAIHSMNEEQAVKYNEAYASLAKSKGHNFLTPEEKIALLKELGFLPQNTQGENND